MTLLQCDDHFKMLWEYLFGFTVTHLPTDFIVLTSGGGMTQNKAGSSMTSPDDV